MYDEFDLKGTPLMNEFKFELIDTDTLIISPATNIKGNMQRHLLNRS